MRKVMKQILSTKLISNWVEFGLWFLGIWPSAKYAKFRRYFCFVVYGVCLCGQFWYVFQNSVTNDMLDLMDSLSLTIAISLVYLKFLNLWWNIGVLYEILVAMKENWDNSEVEHRMDERSMMLKSANISHRCTKYIIFFYLIAVIFFIIIFLVNLFFGVERKLLFPMEMPYNWRQSPFFELTLVVQLFHQTTTAISAGVFNSLILALVLHAGTEMNVIQKAFLSLGTANEDDKSIILIFRNLVIRHQNVITLTENIEKLVRYMALVQFIFNTIVICFLGLVILISAGTSENLKFAQCVSFSFVMILEAFIYCFAGEYISNKSKSIGDAAYLCLWYNMKSKESRNFMMIILRSQKALKLTIGKFTDLSLGRFTSILKAAGSYIAVLRSFY